MRLIDAELLKRHLDMPDCMMPQRGIIEAIDREPTIDPIKHGHWTAEEDSYMSWWICSNCNTHEMMKSDYCPDCGAKMDEAAE